jgi:AcrR family transcriptional regulator
MEPLRSLKKSPVQRRSQSLVADILEATVRVLQRGGAAAVGTRRVAEVAGVSVGSLYQYFADRNALLFAVLERSGLAQLRATEEHLRELARAGTSYRETVRTVVAGVLTRARQARGPAIAAVLPLAERFGLAAKLSQREVRMERLRADLEAHAAELRVRDLEASHLVLGLVLERLVERAPTDLPADLYERYCAEVVELIDRYLFAATA